VSRRPDPSWEYDTRRAARIRELRDQREAPVRRRRRVQPVLLVVWLAGTIALLGVLLFLGFNFVFAPRVMAWVESNPGAIENGLVQDFVEWYRPDALSDDPASAERNRVTVDIRQGMTDTQIGRLLFDQGLIRSPLAFHWAVIQAGREGTLAFGAYDLSPTLRPSQIVAALQGQAVEFDTVAIPEGARLEEIVAAFGETDITMNLEQFSEIIHNPPAELTNQFDFLNDVPETRSLEGYLYPANYEIELSATPLEVATKLLEEFGNRLTPEMRGLIEAKGLTIDEAVIIASIVEREAVLDEERPLIASVYINRIQHPEAETVGLLNADPTLQYGLATFDYLVTQGLPVDSWGTVEWWPQLQVSGGDVGYEVDAAGNRAFMWPEELAGYQTYVNTELPPTPISAPREQSLAAVANAPLDQGLLYFVAGCPGGTRDGSHYFATTLGEHNANRDRANQECAGQ